MTADCVYTALIGNYESLNEQPVAHRCGIDFICFTDDPSLESETWKIIQVEPSWPMDPVRSARALKILGSPDLEHYDRTIWIDNSVVLLSDPTFLFENVKATPLALLDHPFRDTVRDEFAEVLALGFDDAGRILEQLNSYSLLDPEPLDERPYATTVMIRRPCAELTTTMRVWMDHVLRYSRRDQLSVNCVLASTTLPVTRVMADLRACEWASWPHTPHRDRDRGLRRAETLQHEPRLLAKEVLRRERLLEDRLREITEVRDALLAQRDVLEAQREALQVEMAAAAVTSAAALDRTRAALSQAESDVANCRAELEEERRALAEVVEANRRLRVDMAELVASRSWRFTAVFRRIGTAVRRRPRPAP